MANPTSVVGEQIETLRRQHGVAGESVIWILVWLLVSPLVMTSIKTLTSANALNFPYPWMLIGFSNLGTWLFCQALQWLPGMFRKTGGELVVAWKHAIALGILQGLEVGIGADIIHRISLTLRTEIHMLCPALMFITGIVTGVEVFDSRLVLSIAAVTVGGLLASYGTMTWEGLELVPLALLASAFSSVRWVLTQKWLSPTGVKPSPILMALRMSPVTALVGFAVAAVKEPAAYTGLLHLPFPGKVTMLLIIISFGVCLLLVAEMRVVQLTSALLLGLMVPFHNISVILLDASMKGAKVSGLNWMGIMICALASGFYSMARKEDLKDKESLVCGPKTYPAYQSATSGPSPAAPDGMC